MSLIHRAVLFALFATHGAIAAAAGSTTLTSTSSLGIAGNDSSQGATVSTGGAAVLFESLASTLVPGDGNRSSDVFVKVAKKTQRVSINSLGFEAAGELPWDGTPNLADSWSAAISASGKYAVFVSEAANLDLETPTGLITKSDDPAYNESQDTKGVDDIFLRDISQKKTYRISGKMADCTANSKACKNAGAWNIKVETDKDSSNPAISADGRYIAYTTETFAESISNNLGNAVTDAATTDVFLHDTKTHRTELVSGLHDTTGTVTASATSGAHSDFGAVSADGRLVVFTSDAKNLVAGDAVTEADTDADVFAYDTQAKKMFRISGVVSAGVVTAEANGESFSNRFSVAGKSGRYFVAFHSKATNLETASGIVEAAADDNDIFVADLQVDKKTSAWTINEIRRVSGGSIDKITGRVATEANGASTSPAIAAAGTSYVVAYESDADNMLTPMYAWQEDSNDARDIYVYDGSKKTMERANVSTEGTESAKQANSPAISSDGKTIAFDTTDPYLVIYDQNLDISDVFARRR